MCNKIDLSKEPSGSYVIKGGPIFCAPRFSVTMRHLLDFIKI